VFDVSANIAVAVFRVNVCGMGEVKLAFFKMFHSELAGR
jgi:hypothetical protein